MKTLLLLSVPFALVALFILWMWPSLLFGKTPKPLIIRRRDRKIFEASCPDDYSESDAWADTLECSRPYYFREVIWVKNSWLPGGRLEFTGEIWAPGSDREFDVIARQYVLAGCKELSRS